MVCEVLDDYVCVTVECVGEWWMNSGFFDVFFFKQKTAYEIVMCLEFGQCGLAIS